MSTSAGRDEAAVAALAQQTSTAVDFVKSLYDEEIAALRAQATVTSFISVIASRRVKNQLRARRAARSQGVARTERR